MAGRVEAVNISSGGIPKRPVESARVTLRGVEGDSCRNTKIHGGPNQALLIITVEGIEYLQSLGFAVFAGALGENLTTRGLDRRAMRLGQRYRAGTALIELTKLRKPCATLDPLGQGIQKAIYDLRVKAGFTSSERWGLSGFYARVIEEGRVQVRDSISLADGVV